MFRTWIRFNLVGALGMVVQLLFLALFHSMTAMHYLLATLLAVETAILHNFLWHEKWTWKEYRYGSFADSVTQRFFRFHMASGLISLSGNLLLMRVFVEMLHLPIELANLIAIAGCSLCNFLANSRFVFRNKPEEIHDEPESK